MHGVMKNMLQRLKKFISKTFSLRSLRARIFILVLLVGSIPCIVLQYGIVQNYEERAVEYRIQNVQNQLKILANHLIIEDYLNTPSSKVINAELEMLSNLYDGRVLIITGNFNVLKDTYGLIEKKTIISEEIIQTFQGQSIAKYDAENGYIEITTPIVDTITEVGDSQEQGTESGDTDKRIRGVMLTSVSTDYITSTMEILSRKAMIMEAIMIAFVIGLAFILSQVLTRPFGRVTKAINEVQAGYSNDPISVSDLAETELIVEAFNQLLERMKILDDSRQEFVSNVSHELKTPLTSMKVLADALLMQDNVPVELYKEFMGDIVSEIDRENQIITDLLALVKMDKKAMELNISQVDINALTELILKRLRPIARKQDIELVFESARPVIAEVDEVKMTLIMSNLVENAIKYNKEHGWVKVSVDADHQYFTFEVSDSGIGIPEESLTRIYERFYRVDKSHSREIGGTGLGLAITKDAVLAHRGFITLTSTEGEGTCFKVKMPLNHISQ